MIAQINFNDLYTELYKTGFFFGRPPAGPPLTLGGIVGALIPYIFAAAGLLLLLYLLYGGFQLMVSGGDPKKIQSGKEKITGGLIGFIIVFLAFWIVQIIARLLGIQAIINIFG